ncbi:hypothetical protein WR25_06492 [Diploscapter pachys]|uniref:Uncharacterized protein n=1 Tax=Diploscapter pachys TaxID=2018661 RepID=A0A2A2J2K0_9BILA|nr:hypothetical protein WR25_06492 [Diploscapter pachys]
MSSEELSPSMHKLEAELNEGRFERFVAEKGKGERKGGDKLGMESRKQKHQQTRETCRACLDERGAKKERLTQSNQSKSKGEREYGIFGYLSQGLITSFTVES